MHIHTEKHVHVQQQQSGITNHIIRVTWKPWHEYRIW